MPSARLRRTPSAGKPPSRRLLLWLAAGGVAVVGGGFAAYSLFLGDRARHHEYAVEFPADAPRGEPVAVLHRVKAGDVFVSEWESDARFVLSVSDAIDPRQGMNLRTRFTVAHRVDAAPSGFTSTVKALLERVDSDVPDLETAVRVALGRRGDPLAFAYSRADDGRPLRPTTPPTPLQETRRTMFDRAVGGLGDLWTNYLPARGVRLGETWDLYDVASIPGIPDVVRFIAGSTGSAGFPDVRLAGRVHAEAVESKDGEETLRLRVLWTLHQEGDVTRPAKAGWLTTAAKIDGQVWVSTNLGLVWAAEFRNELTSSYLVPNLPTERKGVQTVTVRTRRADEMPE